MDHPSMSTPGGGKDTNKGFKEEGGHSLYFRCPNWENPLHLGQKWDVDKLLRNTFLTPRHTKNYALDLIHQRGRNSF